MSTVTTNNFDSHSVITSEELAEIKALPAIQWADLNFNGVARKQKVNGKIRMVTDVPNPIERVVVDGFDAENAYGRLVCWIQLEHMVVKHKGERHRVEGLADCFVEQAKGIKGLLLAVINNSKDENGRSKYYPDLMNSLDPKQIELNGRESYVYRLISIMKQLGNFKERNAS